MKNTDYNKPSDIWFSEFSSSQLSTQSTDNNFIIRLTEDVVHQMESIQDIHEILGEDYIVIKGLGLPGMFLVQTKIDQNIDQIEQNDNIAYIYKDEILDIQSDVMPDVKIPHPRKSDNSLNIQAIPNDLYYAFVNDEDMGLWGLNPLAGAFHINVESVWDTGVGDRDVIAVISDQGIDRHSDLIDNLLTNTSTALCGSHGTHCAGTVGATGNNGQAVCGVCWRVSLDNLPILCASLSDFVNLINSVTARKLSGQNISVINCSWRIDTAPNNTNLSILQAFQALNDSGVIICASAGNGNENNDNITRIPSTYRVGNSLGLIRGLDNMIVVAAHDRLGNAADFTNWSRSLVDLSAPGVDIISTINNNLLGQWGGTSMSTPHVAGAVALLQSLFPNADARSIIDAILDAAIASPMSAFRANGPKPTITGGKLDVAGAVSRLGGGGGGTSGSVVVKNVSFSLGVENNYPSYGCGSNITPSVSWEVDYQGDCNDSNTTFVLQMLDLDAGLASHWSLGSINGSTRSVSANNLPAGTTINNSTWISLANSDGYTGPFPPSTDTHRYQITITATSSVAGVASSSSSTVRNNTICPAVPISQTPTPTPTPSPTQLPPSGKTYPQSSKELYISDNAGNIFGIDISDKYKPKVVKNSTNDIIRVKSDQAHYKFAVWRDADSHYYDKFAASNFKTGGFKTGLIYSDKNTDIINNIISIGDNRLSYLIITFNQKIINLEHWFRNDSNIRLSFDTGSQTKFLQLDNVSVCPLKNDQDGYASEYLLSTTTSLPDYIYLQGWYVKCPTNSALNRFFYNQEQANIYKNNLISTGCSSASVSTYSTVNDGRFTSLPNAFVVNDRKGIYLQVVPKRGTAIGGGKNIANAYRQFYEMKSPIEYKEDDRYLYYMYAAGYSDAKNITNIPTNNTVGLGRKNVYSPCSTRPDIGLMAQTRLNETTNYQSAMKVIAGKYQTISIDSNGDAYYTGNNNYGPFNRSESQAINATGGIITTSGIYKIHTFTSNGTFTITSAPANAKYEILVVGGGGSGGANRGGGGGAGEFYENLSQTMDIGSYVINIGSGGIAPNRDGGNTTVSYSGAGSFNNIQAIGGGGGGTHGYNNNADVNGRNGASGGGASQNFGLITTPGLWPIAGNGILGKGNNGGRSVQGSRDQHGGQMPPASNTGGGGGYFSEGLGGDINTLTLPHGGAGITSAIDGKIYCAGGGGGDGTSDPDPGYTTNSVGAGNGGSNRAGNGGRYSGNRNGTAALDNSGSGGGGGGFQGNAGNGGSGIVIIRYKIDQDSSGSSNYMTKIQAYNIRQGLTSPTPVYQEISPNFVDAAIMTYNHEGVDKGDRSTYTVFLLDDKGELYTFGYDASAAANHQFYCRKYQGKLISVNSIKPDNTFPIDNISSISAGADHVIVVRHGQAFGKGSNIRGQLGFNNTISQIPEFTKIPGGYNSRLTKVACGPYHTMFLDIDGRISVTGDNTCGQLGLGLNPNLSKNDHARYGMTLLETPQPAKDIFASNVGDHYVYQVPCTTNGRTRACNIGEDPNKPPIRSKSNCGYVDVLGRLWVWGDRTYSQSGNLLPLSYNGGSYVADGKMMISPIYVPYFYTAFRGSIIRNQDTIDNIPASYTALVQPGYFVNMNFAYQKTTSASLYNSNNNQTFFTIDNNPGILPGMWIQIGDLYAWGTGSDKGQVISVVGNTIGVSGNYPIPNNVNIAFKAFPQHTRIISIENNIDGTLKAIVSSAASYSKTYSNTDFQNIVYSYYYLRPNIIDSGKDGIGVVDTAGRFIQWGLDKGYRGCSNIDKTTSIPWMPESTRNYRDFIDFSYGLEHLIVLRKEKAPE